MSFLCCNWCLNIFGHSEQKKQNKKAYQQSLGEDLDEEQLIEQTGDKTSFPQQYISQQEESQDLSNELDVEMKLQDKRVKKDDEDKSQTSSKGEGQNHDQIQDIYRDYNQNLLDEVPTEDKLVPDYTKFSINLDPYDKYYKLLHEKTDNLQKYFTLQGKPIDFGHTKSKLRISKIDSSKFQVKFELPCSYSFYSMLMKDSNLTGKKYLTHFEKHQILQSFKPNFTKNITKMKRFNMLQPRQFVYLKYSNGSFKQNWEICINDSEQDLFSEKVSDHKRCDIFSVSNFKEINDRLYVHQYIELDLKSSSMNTNIWGKIMHEVKQYFQKLYLHAETYYQKQLL